VRKEREGDKPDYQSPLPGNFLGSGAACRLEAEPGEMGQERKEEQGEAGNGSRDTIPEFCCYPLRASCTPGTTRPWVCACDHGGSQHSQHSAGRKMGVGWCHGLAMVEL
jgi:hypothetical protein